MKTLKRHLLIAITVLTVSACSSNGIHEKIEQIEVAHQKQVDKKMVGTEQRHINNVIFLDSWRKK